jgi:hypothetical protein
MRAISRLVLVAALIVGLAPDTASAQRWTADFGVNGGYSWYSQMLDDAEVANHSGARFRAGWLAGSQLTFWVRPGLGLRANMTYTDRPLVADNDIAGRNTDVLYGNVNLWSGSGDLLFRLRQPAESWIGRETLPYIALGLGGKWVNPAGDHWTCVDTQEQKSWECARILPGQNVVLALGERSVPMGLVGLGADFRMSPRVALRAEINDRIYKPPVYAVSNTQGTNLNLPSDERVTNWTHEVGAQLGLHFLMGVRTPPPVAVAPLPPAPPPPAPPPAPQPEAPRVDAITVCVIDPTATGGVRMQTASFRHATRDTVVMVDGQARPLAQVVGTGVMTARNANWYVRGEPLTITINRADVRYLPYQTATRIEPARIVYIGSVQGFPVYADRDEIADVLPALQTARGTRTGADADLGRMLAGVDARTRDTVQRAAFLYVPMDPYGCVFQPVQRVEDVRKGK